MHPSSIVNWIALLNLDEAFVLVALPVAFIAGLGALMTRLVFGTSIASTSTVGTTKAGAAAEIYAVVLGFVILFGFGQFQETKRAVVLESFLLERLLSEVNAMPVGGDEVTSAIEAYTNDVVEIEWPLQAIGKSDDVRSSSFFDLQGAVREIANVGSDFDAFRLNQIMGEIMEQRVVRLSASPDPVVAMAVFQILAVGIVLSVITGWFVRGPSVLLHMALSAIISGSVVFLMVLSAQLLYPFSGPISISPEPFEAVQASVGR